MSTEQKPVLAPAPAAVPVLDPNAMMALIQLLLAQQQEVLLEKQEKARSREARESQRRITSQFNEAEQKQRESMCTHKKGGRKGPRSAKLDYAVYFHTFTDSSSYIRCQICGAKWKSQDTTEYLVRRGDKVPNHTRIGWREAHQMLGQSTNQPSSSEVMITQAPILAEPVDFKKNPHAVEV